jgi:hypothetical protein
MGQQQAHTNDTTIQNKTKQNKTVITTSQNEKEKQLKYCCNEDVLSPQHLERRIQTQLDITVRTEFSNLLCPAAGNL